MDFACGPGTPIRAAADGQVIFAGTKGGYGTAVVLRHSAGYTTLYGHCSRTAVESGEFVKAGRVIAYSGNTGRTTGPHLHFEVRKYGIPKDPTGALHLAGQH
jgi:murein DD-endopeptidase MepM/ murein hydrolase activator NlpD